MTDSQRAAPPRVLIVEDEGLIAAELEDRLQNLGYAIAGIADTADIAVDLALATQPDVVLMDIRLKGKMDGIEAADRIHRSSDIPIVYVTAHSDPATFERARRTMPDGYVLKPLHDRDLMVSVELALHRHAVGRSLRASEARFATTLACIADGVIATDSTGQVSYLNPVAEELTGWALDQARGLAAESVFSVTHEPDGGAMANPLVRAFQERQATRFGRPMLLRTRTGEQIPIEDSAAPITDRSGELSGAVVTFRDSRPRREAEARQRVAQEQLRHAQRMEGIGRLAGGVAHDFNNLLTMISGFAEELLARGHVDAVGREVAQGILEAGQRGARLTRQLLRIGQSMPAGPHVVSLAQLLAEFDRLLQRTVGRGYEWSLEMAPDLPHVRIDTGTLEQAVLNLVLNAADATPSGGRIELRARTWTVRDGEEPPLPGLPPGSWAEISVRDNGRGIDPVVRAHVMEPFVTGKAPGHGSGLGLANVYEAIREAGGRMHIDSALGQGTEVRLFLPGLAAGALPAGAAPEVTRAGREVSPTARRVLLVEDEDGVRRVLTLALERLGHEVVAVASAAQALDVGTAGEPPFDVLVTDVLMPGIGGGELARRMTERFPSLRVIFVSGFHDDDDVRDALARPGVRYLRKPFPLDTLGQTITELIEGTDTGPRAPGGPGQPA